MKSFGSGKAWVKSIYPNAVCINYYGRWRVFSQWDYQKRLSLGTDDKSPRKAWDKASRSWPCRKRSLDLDY